MYTSPLGRATKNRRLDKVKVLLQNGFGSVRDRNRNYLECLHLASMKGNLEIFNELLNYNPDLNICDARGYHALISAAGYGHLKIVHLLITTNIVTVRSCVPGNTRLH